MNYRVVIIVPPGYSHASCFLELAYCIKSSFVSLGHSCDIAVNDMSPSGINVVLGYHLLRSGDYLRSYNYIAYQLEQLGKNAASLQPNTEAVLRTASAVWDFSHDNIDYLNKRGIQAHYLPPGYHENLCQIPVRDENDKDIDLLFYGTLGQRRKKILQQLAGYDAYRLETLFGVYGKKRDEYIARARIVLNIHHYETKLFEAVRISYLLNNGCFVLSEEADFNPYDDVGLASVGYESIPRQALYWLENPLHRQRVAQRNRARFQQHYYMPRLMEPVIAKMSDS